MIKLASYPLTLTILLAGCIAKDSPQSNVLRLATTTSTRDSGLLDEMLPPFEREHGVRVDVIAVGTGKALKLGAAGDADVVLVHARAAEDAFMAEGHGIRREDVMHNSFQILGSPDDPAEVRGKQPVAALRQIANVSVRFVSRGDDSGTHKRELKLWDEGGGLVDWPEYIETGQGMGASLVIADEMRAYILCDRGTYLWFKEKIDLVPLISDAQQLLNPYGIIVVNPENHPGVRSELAHALVDYMVSEAAQALIGTYRIDGEKLFHPARAGE